MASVPWNSQVKYVVQSWGSVVKTSASVFLALYFVYLSSPSDLCWICPAASEICWSLLVSAWLSLKCFSSFICLWPLFCCKPKDAIWCCMCQTRSQIDSLSLPCFHCRPPRKTLFRIHNKTKILSKTILLLGWVLTDIFQSLTTILL